MTHLRLTSKKMKRDAIIERYLQIGKKNPRRARRLKPGTRRGCLKSIRLTINRYLNGPPNPPAGGIRDSWPQIPSEIDLEHLTFATSPFAGLRGPIPSTNMFQIRYLKYAPDFFPSCPSWIIHLARNSRAFSITYLLILLLLSSCTEIKFESPPSTEPATASLEALPTSTEEAPTPIPGNSLTLRDVAADVGLVFQHGAFRESLAEDPAAMMGGGLCWLDFDGDGWLDLYVVNSHARHEQSLGDLPRNALFHNQGDGTFREVSAASRTDLAIRGNGCIAGDIDQDGDPDLYLTADGPNALLLNQGDGTFREAAAAAGVDAAEWNTAAALGDFDGDGLVDLYVAAYIDLEKKVAQPLGLFPQDYLGLPDHLYRNNGDGTFSDVAQEAGLTHQERGLGAVFSDLDLDGDLDLYVANDGHPNRLYHNNGDGTFSDIAQPAGVNDRGSGMGVAAGDYDGDGRFDLVVTNFDKEYNALYRSQTPEEVGELAFTYATFRMGIQGFGQNQTGWGAAWLDLDLDGDQDLMTVQGKVPITDLSTDAEPIRLYLNRNDGTFRDASRQFNLPVVGPRLARGMAVADYDNDGDPDIAIANIGGPLTLLQNDGTSGNWLILDRPVPAPGTRLRATLPDSRILLREVQVGSSYLSSHDPRFQLGLGQISMIPHLEITLPNGQQIVLENVAANQIVSY